MSDDLNDPRRSVVTVGDVNWADARIEELEKERDGLKDGWDKAIITARANYAALERERVRADRLAALLREAGEVLKRLYMPDSVSNEEIVSVTQDALALLARLESRDA